MIRSTLAISLIFTVLLTSCIGFSNTSRESNHFLETNDEFEVIWGLTGINLYTSKQRPLLVSPPGKFILEGWNDEQALSLFAFDSLNGDALWQMPFNSNNTGDIISDDTQLYRGTSGASKVQAYNTDNGQLIWQTSLPLAHSTSEIYFANNKIYVFTTDNMFFILNEQGDILDSRHETFTTYVEIGNILYFEENISLKAVDSTTREELWQVKIDDRFTHSPIFDDGAIFLRTWAVPGYVYSIDQKTGKINWKVSQDVLSNLAVSEDKIYFISFDSHITVLDRHSGSEMAKIKLSPQFDLINRVDRYFIAVDTKNNVLALSFGDNTQLLGIKILNP